MLSKKKKVKKNSWQFKKFSSPLEIVDFLNIIEQNGDKIDKFYPIPRGMGNAWIVIVRLKEK